MLCGSFVDIDKLERLKLLQVVSTRKWRSIWAKILIK